MEIIMKIISFFLSILALSFFSATSSFADNSALAKEVMAIHDDAMAKMTHIHELKLKLKEVEDKHGKSEETSNAILRLKNAHNGMMKWMRQYKHPDPPTETEEMKEYLLSEKAKIQKVSDDIENSISTSESLLK